MSISEVFEMVRNGTMTFHEYLILAAFPICVAFLIYLAIIIHNYIMYYDDSEEENET